ncbi:MAG: Rps23 Pro-64 3,4-dihydroxylase Tpa1-like proline 4-hydroxylase [Gammaproteobacteria bacterium]|jgi:Rps23 Pro-64 3,4-dihydroxylase Tpa1-like proline 4-hydroxylase
MCINIDSAALDYAPFKHFSITEAIDSETQNQYLAWLEESAPWQLVETDFYEQYEFSLLQQDFPEPIAQLASASTLSHLRQCIASLFNTTLSEKVDVTAHKLIPGQTIRIHNDFIPGEETHRVLIQLNRNWNDDFGGQLMLFSGPQPDQLSKIIPPQSGSIQGFAISPDSHHAVSTVHGGERFTIVYSFFSCTGSEQRA